MDRSIKGTGEKIFQVIICVILFILSVNAVMPFLLLISSSVTAEDALLRYGYSFWPTKFSGYAYKYLFVTNRSKILRAYAITVIVTIIGTSLHLMTAPMFAYPLSRKDYKRRGVISFLVIFTMLFNGGMVAGYIIWTQVFHIKNTFFALLFPGLLMGAFNIILYKSSMAVNIHPSLIEAARLDGAGEFYIYLKIVLPLSLPILASLGLMCGIGYWNDWMNGMYYITDSRLYSLQLLLNSILNNIKALSQIAESGGSNIDVKDMPSTGIRMAMAVIGTLPIMALYPFFQKAFVAGITLGGVKE